uniref:cDNA FLJ52209 n=1 Tax=Homo sapiens TaxID=9606 RepID=B4DKI8_HUMAN|nr:unnamed protein product [Homo sapiens]
MFMSETWSPTASADSWREFEGPQGAPGADLWIPGWSWPASAWAPPPHRQACLRAPPPGSVHPPPLLDLRPAPSLGDWASWWCPAKPRQRNPHCRPPHPSSAPQSLRPVRVRAHPGLPRPCPL